MNRLAKALFILLSFAFLIFPKAVYAQVLINEFSSFESSGDWVELYAFEDTDISGWILKDSVSEIETIPTGTVIGPATTPYYVAEVGNRLNVDSDKISLLKPDLNTQVDTVSYGNQSSVCKPESGQSVGRFENGNTIERFSTPTKGTTNVGANLAPCPTPYSTPIPTPSPTITPSLTPPPTKTPTPTPVPIPTKTSTSPPATKKPNPTPTALNFEEVLGVTEDLTVGENSPTPTGMAQATNNSNKKLPALAMVLIISGLMFMTFAGYLIYKKSTEAKIPDDILSR